MKVVVNWGPRRDNVRFKAPGSDLEAVQSFLLRRDEAGSFDFKFSYKWKHDARGQIEKVILMPSYNLSMPAWPAYRRQPASCQAEWDKMWKALKAHEEGHRDIYLQGLQQLTKRLEAMEPVTVAELKEIMERAVKDHQNEHDAYDTSTDHGRSRGVEVTIFDECKSKPKPK